MHIQLPQSFFDNQPEIEQTEKAQVFISAPVEVNGRITDEVLIPISKVIDNNGTEITRTLRWHVKAHSTTYYPYILMNEKGQRKFIDF